MVFLLVRQIVIIYFRLKITGTTTNVEKNVNFSGILIGIPMALAAVFVYKRGCFGLSSNRGAAAYSRAFYKRAEKGDDFNI